MKKTMLPSLAGEISNLNIVFDKQPIISNISVSLYRNQIHMLTGASGSGKTTLLRALNRLNDCFDNCYTQGDITLSLSGKSLSVNNLKTHQLPDLRRKVGMVFQHPQLLPGTVWENLLLPLSVVCHLKGEAAQKRATTALTQAALWEEVKDRLNMPASALSGGQQQRLCLARTPCPLNRKYCYLMNRLHHWIPKQQLKLRHLSVNWQPQYTIVMVSHSALQTQNLADQVIHLEQGRLA